MNINQFLLIIKIIKASLVLIILETINLRLIKGNRKKENEFNLLRKENNHGWKNKTKILGYTVEKENTNLAVERNKWAAIFSFLILIINIFCK